MKQNKIMLKRALTLLIALSVAAGAVTGCMPENSEEIQERPVEQPMPEQTAAEELPRAYSYRGDEMPVLRDQQNTNNCWAFASLSALEASKDRHAGEVYSPDHLIHHNPFRQEFAEGGSYIVTMAYLLSWIGPVRESDDLFDGKSPEGAEACAHVQEVRLSEGKDYERIKRFVYLYGGAETAIYVDFSENIEDSSYYNKKTYAYCYSGEKSSNHDIVIVGWDDDYPAENFSGNVEKDGAFLCRNSWGDRFGLDGNFYVSYEDVNIGTTAVVYSRIDAPDNYELIYQSDLCGFTAQVGYKEETAWIANAYTAENDISVKAAGLYATGENTKYELYIVPDFKDQDSFREKKFLTEGFLEDAGYYTIDFPKGVSVNAGTDFAIVAKITTEGAEYPAAVECQLDEFSDYFDLSDGRGFLSLQGNRWEHVEAANEYNICLKAYADLR